MWFHLRLIFKCRESIIILYLIIKTQRAHFFAVKRRADPHQDVNLTVSRTWGAKLLSD